MDSGLDIKVLLMQELLWNLRHCVGFQIPPVSTIRLIAAEPSFYEKLTLFFAVFC